MVEQVQKPTKEALLAQLAVFWATTQFFTSLQNIMLEKETCPDLELSGLRKQLEELPLEASAQEIILKKVREELEDAHAQIILTDARISVSVMRRFFEKTSDNEATSLKHIIQYYFNKPVKDESDRDKIDLLITRFCSIAVTSPNNIKQRQLKSNISEILNDLCSSVGPTLEIVQTAIVAKLRQLCRLIIEARSFNTLIEGKLISQLRDYKISLGDMFYVPAVLEEIIRMNIAVHNKFQELYFSEQARLRMETARMLHTLQTGRHLAVKEHQNPLIHQLNSLTFQLQQCIQDLRRNLTDQIIHDRSLRASIEAEGNSLTLVINSLEDSLLRSRDLLGKLQDVYSRLEPEILKNKEVLATEVKLETSNSSLRKIDFTNPESLDKPKVTNNLEVNKATTSSDDVSKKVQN